MRKKRNNKKEKKQKITTAVLGFAAGFINGLFGTGGGMVIVPLMEEFVEGSDKKTEKTGPFKRLAIKLKRMFVRKKPDVWKDVPMSPEESAEADRALAVKRQKGMDPKKAHATSVIVIAALSLVSICFYLGGNTVKLSDVYLYIIGGIVGAPAGAFLLKKLKNIWIKRAFGAFLIYAAVRIFLTAWRG